MPSHAARRTPHAALWVVFALSGCPAQNLGKGDSGDGGDAPPTVSAGLPSTAVGTVDAGGCGAAVPAARSFHAAAWFFLDSPVEAAADRWVERGILVTGGQSESTGDLLADSWLFDLTNLGVAECPWISLGSSGSGSASSSLGWDPTRGRFVRVGGFADDGVSQYTDDGVYTATVQELVDGLGWTVAGALPDRTVSTSSIGDGDAEALPWPVLDCEEPYSRAAPCDWADSLPWSDFMALITDGCDSFNPAHYVTEWGLVSPAQSEVQCKSGLAPHNSWYLDACADDPYVLTTDNDASMAYDSASSPGRAEASGAFDPVTGVAWVHGGTTGCEGSCAAWADVGQLDLSGRDGLHLANGDELLQLDGAVVTNEGVVHPGALAETVMPPDTSYGRRAAGSAWVGVDWDFAAGEFTGAGWIAAVGGTRHHELGLGRQHELRCEDETGDSMNACGYCVDTTGAWIEGEPAYTDAVDGLVSGSMVLSVLDPGAAWSGQGDVGARVYAAASWFGGDEMLLWGGSGASGARSDLLAWDTQGGGASGAGAWYAASEPWGPREGGTAVYDPITRTAYLFGGANDTAVYTFARQPGTADAALVSGAHANLQQGVEVGATVEPEVRASITSADGVAWLLGSEWEVEVDCLAGVDCFVDTLSMYVATETSSELDDFSVTVTYDDHGDSYTLEPFTKTYTGEGDTFVQVRLPRLLTDGGGVDVNAGWFGSAREFADRSQAVDNNRQDATLGKYPLGADDASTPEDDRPALVILADAPVIPGGLEGGGFRQLTEFNLPAGWQGVAGGTPDTAFGAYTASAYPSRGSFAFPSLMSTALVLDRTLTTTLGASVYLWRDDGIALTPSAHSGYLTDSTGDARPEADVAWLEATVRPFATEPVQVVLTRRSAAEELGVAATASWTAGEAFPGLTQVLAADVGGTPTAEARSVVLHELVHELFLFRHLPDGGVLSTGRWWAEGSARLVEHLRLSDGASLRATATALAAATCAGYGDDPELEADDAVVAYEFGAYTVAQLHWSYLAAGGTAADFWVEVQALHSTAGELDSVTLDDFISTQLGLPRFYAEWVMADRRGTPLVSLTDVSPDNSACLDTGPCEPTSATMTVSQVQDLQMTTANGCLHDAPLFTDVPWFLQCHPPGYAEPTFFECDAGATTLFSSMPRTLSGASAVVALTVDPLMAAVAWPTWIRPIANDALLPGGVPAEGVYATGTRAYVVCARPGDADCGGDNDGDGWSMDAECNDAEPTWNPGVTPGPLAGPDTNCDGW